MGQGLTTIWYAELGVSDNSSPRFSLSVDESQSTRKIICLWEDVAVACREILGYVFVSGGTASGLSRWLPEASPTFPWMYATHIIDVAGIRWEDVDDGGQNAYAFAEITFSMGFLPYDVLDDSEVTSEFERWIEKIEPPSGKFITLPEGVMSWAPEDPTEGTVVAVPFKLPLSQVEIEITYRWHMVPYSAYSPGSTLYDTVLNTLGKVNATEFDGYAPGTLLLEGADPIPQRGPDGTWLRKIEYKMRWFGFTHNRLLRSFSIAGVPKLDYVQVSIDGTYYPPGSIPDSVVLYDETEFADLFTVL